MFCLPEFCISFVGTSKTQGCVGLNTISPITFISQLHRVCIWLNSGSHLSLCQRRMSVSVRMLYLPVLFTCLWRKVRACLNSWSPFVLTSKTQSCDGLNTVSPLLFIIMPVHDTRFVPARILNLHCHDVNDTWLCQPEFRIFLFIYIKDTVSRVLGCIPNAFVFMPKVVLAWISSPVFIASKIHGCACQNSVFSVHVKNRTLRLP